MSDGIPWLCAGRVLCLLPDYADCYELQEDQLIQTEHAAV